MITQQKPIWHDLLLQPDPYVKSPNQFENTSYKQHGFFEIQSFVFETSLADMLRFWSGSQLLSQLVCRESDRLSVGQSRRR